MLSLLKHPAVRFLFVATVLSAAVGTDSHAEEDLRVLPQKEARGMLKEYLLKECRKHFDARRKTVAAITTPDAFRARQQQIRAAWIEALGGLPERTPLNARVTGTLDRDDYRIEKVLYESRPRHHVTANLYLPKEGKPPFPAVLVPCGHSRNGKACAAYQSMSILLAKHGFVALCYDPIGQGERCQMLDEKGKPIVHGTTEHTLTDVGAMLVGWDCATYRIWDGIRSIDYLISRPEVDPKRIGCTGNSGGGTMTSYLMATDDRIVAAAPSCYLTSLQRLFETIGPQDGEQNIPGQVALGIDHADYLAMRAPKLTLILAATKDFFDISGTWDTYREAKRFFCILGHGERADIFEFPDKHGFSRPRREAALRWMRRWLQGIDDAATEPELTVSKDAELQVSQTGQAVHDLKGVTVWDLNRQQAGALAPRRQAFWKTNPKEKCLEEVRRLAGIGPAGSTATTRSVGQIDREGYRVEKLVIERKDEVPVPGLLFTPKGGGGKRPGILYVDGRGKAHEARPGGAAEKLVQDGKVVLTVDVRGFGETCAKPPKGYFGSGYRNPFLATHLNRPLPGQRVEDALAALEVLSRRPDVDARRLSIVGVERGGPIALHAAALDERIGAVSVEGAIESWMDVVAAPLGKDQLTQVVPGALARYDLPDLVKAVSPRSVHIRNRVNPDGSPKEKAE